MSAYSSTSSNYPNKSYSPGSTPRSSHNASLALDNLIRRELKVTNPNDAKEIAGALLSRYQGTPQAIGITREAEGLPFLRTTPMMPVMSAPPETSSGAELKQAMDDVERDLKELTSNAILKDVTPELEGWAAAIRSMMSEALNSARFALDSSQRDKTFGLRRTLGDYARMARLVGALSSPVVNVNYRNLAQSIDEFTSVLLVMMGESLANVSFNRSRYLLQVPYSELQARRDSAIYALRNFLGSTQTAYAPNEWPRGVDAYRKLYKYLDDHGQGDLRSLLTENELSRIMDLLIQRASHGNIEGLRNLGATAQLELPRLRRLVIIGSNIAAVEPSSPPLNAFLQALQLFIDAFDSAGGFRLLRLARPPILFYGLYGSSSNDEDAETRLVNLALGRNRLAELLDCFLQCGCSTDRIKIQLLLDKVLYDVDRAIDLYALGTAVNPEPEYRSLAYAYIIQSLTPNSLVNVFRRTQGASGSEQAQAQAQLQQSALDTNAVLRALFTPDSVQEDYLNRQLVEVLVSIKETLSHPLLQANTLSVDLERTAAPDRLKDFVVQELCIQRDMERSWLDLVRTMASGCLPFRNDRTLGVFDVTDWLIRRALDLSGGEERDCFVDIDIPPHYEVSLDILAPDVSDSDNDAEESPDAEESQNTEERSA